MSLILALGVPAYRSTVHAEHVTQTLGLVRAAAGKIGIAYLYADSSNLDWSRNYLIGLAIEKGADWLLFCDADTFSQDPEATLRMVLEGMERGAPVIAAPVLTRRHGTYNAVRLVPGEYNLTPDDFRGRVVPVDRIGTAFMAVDCQWVRSRVPHPWFASQQVLHEGRPAWVGEDFSFCDRVKSAGGSILADGRFEPVHVGTASERAYAREAV